MYIVNVYREVGCELHWFARSDSLTVDSARMVKLAGERTKGTVDWVTEFV